jgi:DNA-binding SARP family transcriptional activator
MSSRLAEHVGTRARNERLSQPLAPENVQLGLLGSFRLRVDYEPARLAMNGQRLVCFLALHDGLLLRQHVAGSLWGDTTEQHASGSLRSALWRLGGPGHVLVEVEDSHLRLCPGVAVDIRASEALARRVLDESQDLSEADLDDALLSVDLLPDWTEDWVLVRREYHTQLRLRALEALCRRLSNMGRFGQAVQAGTLAVSGEPLRESAQRVLVTVHLAEGNVGAALKQYDSFRELLRDELRLDPSREMQTLVKGLAR